MFDFIPLLPEKMVLASMSDPNKYLGGDNWLLARPFRKGTWIMIIVVALLLVITMKILSWRPIRWNQKHGISNKSKEITHLTFSFFFLLILAYYEGALIMFFSSDTSLAFDDIKDVMKLYPHRKLMMREAYDVYYLHHVISGDKDYTEFWNRVKQHPEETVFTSVEEVFRKFPGGGVVIHESEKAIRTYLDECGGKRKEHFDAFVQGRAEYRNIIATKNSPLGPILNYGIRLLQERGSTPSFKSSWNMNHTDCQSLRKRPPPSMSMQLRHFSYLFFSLLASIFICFAIFSGEIIWVTILKYFPFLGSKIAGIDIQEETQYYAEPDLQHYIRNPLFYSLNVLEAVGLNYHGKKCMEEKLGWSCQTNQFKVILKTFTCDIFIIKTNPEDTIYSLKKIIEKQSGIPINLQRLVFSGFVLDNDMKRLKEYKILNNSIVNCTIELNKSHSI